MKVNITFDLEKPEDKIKYETVMCFDMFVDIIKLFKRDLHHDFGRADRLLREDQRFQKAALHDKHQIELIEYMKKIIDINEV